MDKCSIKSPNVDLRLNDLNNIINHCNPLCVPEVIGKLLNLGYDIKQLNNLIDKCDVSKIPDLFELLISLINLLFSSVSIIG